MLDDFMRSRGGKSTSPARKLYLEWLEKIETGNTLMGLTPSVVDFYFVGQPAEMAVVSQ